MKPGTSWIRRIVWAWIAALACLVLASDVAAQPDRGPGQDIPPWKRQLSGEAAARVAKLDQRIAQLKKEGQFAEAIEPARKVAEIRTRLQGGDHWQTADALRTVHDLQTIAALPEEGRKAMASVGELIQKAGAERQRGHYAESERISRNLLEIHRRWLGEGHHDFAMSSKDVAATLSDQGKHDAAEPLYRKALAIRLQVLGEDHPETAESFDDVAYNLDDQGKYAEAEPLYRKALVIKLKALGEDHPDTAITYNNFAANLDWQGRYAEAEPLYRRALATWLQALGEDHPYTGASHNNLAINLDGQGRYAEAEPLFRKALAICLKVRGEDHPNAATSYNNLAINLDWQGKHAEAEPLFRKALAIYLKAVGESHAASAKSYGNLAVNLRAQGKHAQAEPLFRRGLGGCLQALGEDHPNTATSYHNLALNLEDQGRYAEAEPLYRRALAIRLKALGADHPHTAQSDNNLASNLEVQGKHAEALRCWTAAAASYERSRGARGASGLERSLTAGASPLPALASALARAGQGRAAWARWETDLARGLLDDLSARLLRPLTADQHRREIDLARQLQRLDEGIARLAGMARRSQDQDKQLDEMGHRQSALRGQWVEFQNALDQQYQAYVGKPSTLGEVQEALAADAALIGWLDVKPYHWACLVRHQSDPVWAEISGSGQDRAWTKEDDERPRALREALVSNRPTWRAPAATLASQRLGPLRPHLEGVTHLIVLPSAALAGVPIEALVAALPAGSPRPLVSYAPSGSMFAHLGAPRSKAAGLPRLLALGDPAFPKPAPSRLTAPPPDHGLAIVRVEPHGIADLFGIKPGDVLLEYNNTVLKSQSDLTVIPAGDTAMKILAKLWRDGEVRSLEIAAGPLGIQSNPERPAAQVVLAQRAAAEVLRSGVRSEGFSPLSGTRREVQAIAALFSRDRVTTLLGPDATESNLQQLAQSGALKTYRFLHLATHGKANPNVALSSAVLLAAEPERPASSSDPAALESAPDGQVTAEQIVRTWELDADLVVLSACESGLGRYAGGEGYLGFAQALFVKGARSLVLSQWRVDDKATALLMARFYQNLLGKRSGLSQPLPKAAALDEAKHWLRELTVDEAGTELAALARGTVRPLVEEVDGPAPRAAASAPKLVGVRPYAHPYYWASFILIGDPR
jgi:tetratricopeptide (TPR) repeat protein